MWRRRRMREHFGLVRSLSHFTCVLWPCCSAAGSDMGQQSSNRATWFWRAKQALRQRGSAVVHLIHRHTGKRQKEFQGLSAVQAPAPLERSSEVVAHLDCTSVVPRVHRIAERSVH